MKMLIILFTMFSFNVIAAPVNINTADATTISESLKGIGQKKAEELVRYRTENGSFESLNDLTKVKGIGEKTVEKNASEIIFSEPKSTSKAMKEKVS